MPLPTPLRWILLGLALGGPLAGRDGDAAKKPEPAAYTGTLAVIGAEVAGQWAGLLPTVNPPALRTRAYPGQHLTVAVGATGGGRDRLLQSATYTFTVTYGGATRTFSGLHPSQVRRIKAEGADFAKYLMEETRIGPAAPAEPLSVLSYALFDLDWAVPDDAADGAVSFQGEASAPGQPPVPLKKATLEVHSPEHAFRKEAFKDTKERDAWVMTYYQHPEPFRILHALRLAKGDAHAWEANVLTFYVEALKASRPAALDLLRRLGGEDAATRLYALLLLSEAGYDVTPALASMAPAERDAYLKARSQAPPLPDPYDFSVDLKDPYRITTRMDMLWSVFLATGAQKPVRALARTLEWREDGTALLDLRESGRKIDQVTPSLLRGMAYGAGGWSLGSFFRSHGLVADFVDTWRQDPKTPPILKEELDTLLTNDAFKGQ